MKKTLILISIISLATCWLAAGNVAVQGAHAEIKGISGKIQVLGFSWGSQSPKKGTFMTNVPPKGVNRVGIIFRGNAALIGNAFSLSKSYPVCVITVRLQGKPAVKYTFFNIKVTKDRGGQALSPQTRWPDGEGDLRDPGDGGPGKVVSVILSMTQVKFKDPSDGDPGKGF